MTARRRTNKRKSMKGITQSVSKKSLRTDKNGQLCDIQPRFGNIHSNYQGRPLDNIDAVELGTEIGTIIGSLNEEQLSTLIAGNKLRAEQFKVK